MAGSDDAIFTDKPGAALIEYFRPDSTLHVFGKISGVPPMAVPGEHGVGNVPAARTARPVRPSWVKVPANIRKQPVVKQMPPDVDRLGFVRAENIKDLLAFIVPAPKRNTGMMPQLPDHRFDLLAQQLAERFVMVWIGVAGHHEILPDHDARTVTRVIEGFAFIDRAAVDSQHVHVGVFCLRDQGLILGHGNTRRNDIEPPCAAQD